MNRVTIAGGGLAGLSLGIALRSRDVPVRLVEASNYPRHRVCGEFISGVSDGELQSLGIAELFREAQRHRGTSWHEGDRELLRASLPDDARGLSRYRLDALLVERLAALGGEVVTGQRFSGSGEGVVLATGRPRRDSRWIGLKAHYEALDLATDLEIHMGRDAYVGLTRVENGRVNVCGLFRRKQPVAGADSREQMLPRALDDAAMPGAATRLRAASVDTASIKGVNQFFLGWQRRADEGEVRIGDTAAMIPPFTGNGMSMAFQSALIAVEPLVDWSKGSANWRNTAVRIRDGQRKRFASRLRWSWLLHGLLLTRSSRRFCTWTVRRNLVSFDTLYRKVR
jgi:menaquinone-9 beta-reductase